MSRKSSLFPKKVVSPSVIVKIEHESVNFRVDIALEHEIIGNIPKESIRLTRIIDLFHDLQFSVHF